MNEIVNLQLYGHYYHKRTNNLYKIIEFVKVKNDNDGKWYDGIRYTRADKESQSFVCTVTSFINRFKNA